MLASLPVPFALLPLAGWLTMTVQGAIQFERISVSGLGGAHGAWVDVDNDGDLDVVFAGGTGVAVFRNDGTGHFAAREILPANDGRAFTPSLQWLDYNRDGWMDVLLNGPRDANTGAVPRAAILVSQQGISFTAVTAPNGYSELGAAGDADGDGDADLITDISGFYRQDGPAGLVKPTEPSDARSYAYGPLWSHGVRWLDLDGDGDLDVIRGTSRPFASINALPTGFVITEFFGITNSQVSPTSGFPSLFWSDANLDGLPDYFWSRLLVAGGSYMSTGEVCTGSGDAAFTPVTIPGADIARTVAAWGDVDGDGDEDLFVSGWTDNLTAPLAGLWLNNRAAGWSQTPLPPEFDGRPGGVASWGDADQDGRLDLLVSNSSGTEVWRNISASPNLLPAIARGLSATAQPDGQVLLAWDPPAGDETPAVSLTWNLRVGTAPGAGDIVSPCADTASGRRRLTGPGNQTWGPPRARLRLPSGTYYWSVQAVDAGYAGGPFAAEQAFTVAGVPLVHTGLTSDEKGTSLKLHGTLDPMGVERSYSFEWGTTPAMGQETPLRTLSALAYPSVVSATLTGLSPGRAIYYRLKSGSGQEAISGDTRAASTASFERVFSSSLEHEADVGLSWVDLGGDGFFELITSDGDGDDYWVYVLRNTSATSGGRSLSVYLPYNDPMGWLHTSEPWLRFSAWGDAAGDGKLSLAASIDHETAPIFSGRFSVYRPNANGKYSQETVLDYGRLHSPAWVDVDNDGDLDLSGILRPNDSPGQSSQPRESRLWKNDGAGGLTSSPPRVKCRELKIPHISCRTWKL